MAQTPAETRLARLEDIEALKQLKAIYCYDIDRDEIDHLLERFTDDAVWDGGPMGRFEGRDAIAAFLRGLGQQMSFYLHLVMNPLLHVDGDTATGVWYLVEPSTAIARSGRERALWGAGRYEEEYVRQDGVWKFRRVRLVPIFWTPYDQGWAERRSVFER